MCELLVSLRIVRQKIVFTRLPVGHTHEDIDARFGNIWTQLRDKVLITPDDYSEALMHVFKDDSITTDVVDIFAVPGEVIYEKCEITLYKNFHRTDYKSWLETSMNPYFERCFRDDYTHLQFKFDYVGESEKFPMGVKLRIRPYSQDQYIEIVQVPEGRRETGVAQLLGLQPYCLQVHEGPADPTEGYVLLQGRPIGVPKPAEFIKDSRAKLDKALAEIKKYLSADQKVINDWTLWAEKKVYLEILKYMKV